MNEQVMNSEDMVEVSIKRLLDAVLHRVWIVGMASVLGALIVLLGTLFLITPKYESSAMFYVNNNAISVGDMSLSSITSSDITASRNLVNSYVVILNTRESLNDVIDYAGVDLTYKDLKKPKFLKLLSPVQIPRKRKNWPAPLPTFCRSGSPALLKVLLPRSWMRLWFLPSLLLPAIP